MKSDAPQSRNTDIYAEGYPFDSVIHRRMRMASILIVVGFALFVVVYVFVFLSPTDVRSQVSRTLTLSATSTLASEGGYPISVSIGMNPQPTSGSWSQCGLRAVASDPGDATAGTDYTLPANDRTLNQAGTWSATVPFTVTDDDAIEAVETANIEAFCTSSSSGAQPPHGSLTSAQLTFTVIDNDPPLAPANFTAVPNNRWVALSWDNPMDSTITRWRLSFRKAGESYSPWAEITPTASGNSFTYIVSSLDNGATYSFRVRAVKDYDVNMMRRSLESPWAEASATPGSPYQTGTRIASLTLNAGASVGVSVIGVFADPDGDDSDLTYSAVSSVPAVASVTVSGTVVTVTPLTAGTTTITVTAMDTDGLMSQATFSVTVQGSTTPGVPRAPSGFLAVPGDRRISLSWNSLSDSTISKWQYSIRSGNGGYGSWIDIPNSGPNTMSYVIPTSLSNGVYYTVRLRAVNNVGDGVVAASSQVAPSRAPRITGPTSIRIREQGSRNVATFQVERGRDVTWSLDGDDEHDFDIDGNGLVTFDDIPDYEDPKDRGRDNRYSITVVARDRATRATDTHRVTITVYDRREPPERPERPIVTGDREQIYVEWRSPENTGPPIRDYDLRYRQEDSSSWRSWSHSGTSRTATITGLSRSTRYEVQVRASNTEGTSAYSPSSRLTSTSSRYARPTATPTPRRPRRTPIPDPQNPPGPIPSHITDVQGNRYTVFTPEEGGSVSGSDFSITSGPGSIKDGTIIGIRADSAGDAARLNFNHPKYDVTGYAFYVKAVSSAGFSLASGYRLNRPITVCLDVPRVLSVKSSSMYVISKESELIVKAIRTYVYGSGTASRRACGDLSVLPSTVALGIDKSEFAPPPSPTPAPTLAPEYPNTGAYAPSRSVLPIFIVIGFGIIAMGVFTLAHRNRQQNKHIS